MISVSLLEFMVLCNSILLVLLLVAEVLNWAEIFFVGDGERYASSFSFDYANENGPHAWKTLFPESNGNNQSPINIITRTAIVMQPSEPLRWTGYATRPTSMILSNMGSKVVLTATWSPRTQPCIQGGPLNETFEFSSMAFRWGQTDEEGSEHTLNYTRYPMELQVLHLKKGFELLPEFDPKMKDSIVIVTFFFQITETDNPYLDQIVRNLRRITYPESHIHISPFPLQWIFPTFEKKYYSYSGSLTHPPCSEIVTWIIKPEPIAISSSQVHHFRKLHSTDGPILLNCRPVQLLNDRDVYYHE